MLVYCKEKLNDNSIVLENMDEKTVIIPEDHPDYEKALQCYEGQVILEYDPLENRIN
ncbi:hypothetical protein [Aerococcus christensenii]|uniref:hypothetical protein n=1 Tax=Aerococcus christensenii TaxID=87541 RepID=UPI0023A937C9|nr:hypothetical protein [Aerococcus christensenii]WEB71711.1 hypothetical protein PUW42_03980 [Aerococcus christensenii]